MGNRHRAAIVNFHFGSLFLQGIIRFPQSSQVISRSQSFTRVEPMRMNSGNAYDKIDLSSVNERIGRAGLYAVPVGQYPVNGYELGGEPSDCKIAPVCDCGIALLRNVDSRSNCGEDAGCRRTQVSFSVTGFLRRS